MARNNASEFLAKRWSSHTLSRLTTDVPSEMAARLNEDVKPDKDEVRKTVAANKKAALKALNVNFVKGKYRCNGQTRLCKRIEHVWKFARTLGATSAASKEWRKEKPYVIINDVKTYILYQPNLVELEVVEQPF